MDSRFIILKTLIMGLLICLLFLSKRFRSPKNSFTNKELKLMRKISAIKEKQLELNNKACLSNNFNQNYQQSENAVVQSIYEANIDFLKNNS